MSHTANHLPPTRPRRQQLPVRWALAGTLALLSLWALTGTPWAPSADGPRASSADGPLAPTEGWAHVRWTDAGQVVGQRAFVSGQVVRVGHADRVHFLDFDRRDRTAFTVVIFSDALEQFPDTLESLYENQLVEVFGTVQLYEGNPQIVVTSPSQIKVLDELPPVVLPAQPRTPAGNQLRIATFNVRNLFDDQDDPYRDDESTPAKSREEMQALAATLRSVNADVLALQEVENRDYLERFFTAFASDLGYSHVVHFEGNDLRGIDVSLASRIPVGAVTSNRHIRFAGPDGRSMGFQRDVLQVVVLPPGGASLEVWVVHLKSNYGGRDAAEPIRLAEARMLRNMLDQRLQRDPKAAIVVCGDFNDTLESPSLQTIVGDGPTALRTFVEDVPQGRRITYNEAPYQDMIDFLLCSPAMAGRYVDDSYHIRSGTLQTHGSDHNPVFADFSIGDL